MKKKLKSFWQYYKLSIWPFYSKKSDKKKNKNDGENFLLTLVAALILATIIRCFLYEPFHIPSSSMKPGLLIGDYIFVSKYSYGYSKYSLPFSPNLFSGRIFRKIPQRGDVVVFRLPTDPKINYIKRLIGLPGDVIQVVNGQLFINEKPIDKKYFGDFLDEDGSKIAEFNEILPEGRKVSTLDSGLTPQDDTGIYIVPTGYYFMMGDNRDNSQDSRFAEQVGFVPEENLVGKAQIIFFSISEPIWKFWRWYDTVRINHIFKKIN